MNTRDSGQELVPLTNKGKRITLVHDSAVYLATYMPLETIKADECPDDLRGPVFDGRAVIEWHRIKDFQLVSLKLLAEQLLLGCPQPADAPQRIGLFVPGELPLQKRLLRSKVNQAQAHLRKTTMRLR